MAHDFNNLLTVILGNAETLADQLPDKAQLRLIAETTAVAARRGAVLTQRLLAFAECQMLEPKRVDAAVLIAEMEARLSRALPDMIQSETISARDLPLISADPHHVELAVLELAINARDAMPAGGRLTVRTDNVRVRDGDAVAKAVKPGAYVTIAVTDDGHGMDAETRSRAFEPFFTTKEAGAGSGLGLAMIHGFMRQSGGYAVIRSASGRGTTVILYFPVLPTDGALSQ